MKTIIGLFAAVVLWTATANAQIRVNVGQSFWFQGLTVRVGNALADRKSIEVGLVGSKDRVIIPAGENVEIKAGSGSFLFYGNYSDVAIVAKVCEGVARISSRPNIWYNWMSDETFLGGLAITGEYLDSAPSEKELELRVREIKNFLDGNKVLGRKEMKKEIDRWFKAVKESGLRGELACVGSESASYTFRVNHPRNARQNIDRRATLFVRGGWGKYKFDRN